MYCFSVKPTILSLLASYQIMLPCHSAKQKLLYYYLASYVAREMLGKKWEGIGMRLDCLPTHTRVAVHACLRFSLLSLSESLVVHVNVCEF